MDSFILADPTKCQDVIMIGDSPHIVVRSNYKEKAVSLLPFLIFIFFMFFNVFFKRFEFLMIQPPFF